MFTRQQVLSKLAAQKRKLQKELFYALGHPNPNEAKDIANLKRIRAKIARITDQEIELNKGEK